MTGNQANNPLHGITLEKLLTQLVDHFGWPALAVRIKINCFKSDPSIKSSLKFLRKTPWAREKVEQLYIKTFSQGANEPAPKKKAPKSEHQLSPWQQALKK